MQKFGITTKKALTDELKAYLKDATTGRVTSERIDDLMKELLKYSYPDLLETLDYFEVGSNFVNRNTYFVRDQKGHQQGISYRWIIRSYTPLSRRTRNPVFINKLIEAGRNEIKPQIERYRNLQSQFGVIDDRHVDHVVPFIKLLSDWYKTQPEAQLPTRVGKNDRLYFKLCEHSQSWQEYHQQHTQLQMLDNDQNYKKGASGIKIDWYALINAKKNDF